MLCDLEGALPGLIEAAKPDAKFETTTLTYTGGKAKADKKQKKPADPDGDDYENSQD
jgi:hypothetical protein